MIVSGSSISVYTSISNLVRASPAHHRHHRDPGPGVVRLLDQRERPEVRRRPVEDDGEQIDRRQIEPAGHGRPAHQRRKRAGGAADHDVLRARPLEPDGVDEDVEQEPAQREPRAERVDPVPEDRKGREPERHPERQPEPGRDPSGRDRAEPRARHPGVDVPVEPHVDRVGAAGHQVAAQEHPEELAPGREPGRRDEHRRDRRDQQQRDDPRLGQRDQVGGEGRAPRRRAPPRRPRARRRASGRSGTPAGPAPPRPACPPAGAARGAPAAAGGAPSPPPPRSVPRWRRAPAAAARRSGCPAASARRLTRLTITSARPRKAKASTRCAQCSAAEGRGRRQQRRRRRAGSRGRGGPRGSWRPARRTGSPRSRAPAVASDQPVGGVPRLEPGPRADLRAPRPGAPPPSARPAGAWRWRDG